MTPAEQLLARYERHLREGAFGSGRVVMECVVDDLRQLVNSEARLTEVQVCPNPAANVEVRGLRERIIAAQPGPIRLGGGA